MITDKIIGFIYRIDYIGTNPILQGLSYAGSKRINSKPKWDLYFGSPSKKNCIKCIEWKKESKINKQDFKKEIIEYAYEGESLIQKEINYMRKISHDIKSDPKWLNSCIPKMGGFPEYKFTKEETEERMKKFRKTLLEKTGNVYGNFANVEKRRESCMKKYGVIHFNKTEAGRKQIGMIKKKYFESMTEEEKKQHGQKSLKNRNKENVFAGSRKAAETRNNFDEETKKEIQEKRKKSWYDALKSRSPEHHKIVCEKYRNNSYYYQKTRYVTIEDLDTKTTESRFINDWRKLGYPPDSIGKRARRNSLKPLYLRKLKKWIRVVAIVMISRHDLDQMN